VYFNLRIGLRRFFCFPVVEVSIESHPGIYCIGVDAPVLFVIIVQIDVYCGRAAGGYTQGLVVKMYLLQRVFLGTHWVDQSQDRQGLLCRAVADRDKQTHHVFVKSGFTGAVTDRV